LTLVRETAGQDSSCFLELDEKSIFIRNKRIVIFVYGRIGVIGDNYIFFTCAERYVLVK
jgi:hypothetical protein